MREIDSDKVEGARNYIRYELAHQESLDKFIAENKEYFASTDRSEHLGIMLQLAEQYLDGRIVPKDVGAGEIERYSKRDGNATINLLMPTKDNPFNQVELKHVDFGVADNVYVVELPKSVGAAECKLTLDEKHKEFLGWVSEQFMLYGSIINEWWANEGCAKFMEYSEKRGQKFVDTGTQATGGITRSDLFDIVYGQTIDKGMTNNIVDAILARMKG